MNKLIKYTLFGCAFLTLIVEAKNIAIVGGKSVILPPYLQGPPVTLGLEKMRRSVYIFERSLLFMEKFFYQSKIYFHLRVLNVQYHQHQS